MGWIVRADVAALTSWRVDETVWSLPRRPAHCCLCWRVAMSCLFGQNYIYHLMSCIHYPPDAGIKDTPVLTPALKSELQQYRVLFYFPRWKKKLKHIYLYSITSCCFFPAVILIHASLRLRNMKNRLENKIEGVGLKKTPMGVIMDLLDQQEERMNKIQDFIESKLKE